MRDTVLVHDLGTTELQVRRVDLAAKHLVESRGTGEDDGLALDLHCALSEANKVGTDTDRTSSDESDGEDVVVRTRGLSSNQTRALQTLDTKAVLKTDDVGNLVAALAVLLDLDGANRSSCRLLDLEEVLVSEVEILDTLLGLLGIVPRHREQVHDLLRETDTRT